LNDNIKEFVKNCSKEKCISTSGMLTRIEDKFGVKCDYQATANIQKSISQELFGQPADDAENMKEILMKLKEKYPDFLAEILKDETTNRLKAVVFATPFMKKLAFHFMDLLVLDTTYGTNRFRMKSVTLCGKDNNNKTIIFAQGLVTQETLDQFNWLLTKVKEYFAKQPKFILIDADPSLIGAVENVFPISNLKLCGWHTENNFKNHLVGTKKSKIYFSIKFKL